MTEKANNGGHSSRFFETFATLVPTDLAALAGKACRWIDVPSSGAGTVIVKRLDGTIVTLPAMAGDWRWSKQCVEIVGGTATNVVISW